MLLLLIFASIMFADGSPPYQNVGFNIIRPKRGIDLASAHGLQTETRLGTDIEPTLYALRLEPNIENSTFNGSVTINITWVEETDKISLHCSHELKILNSEIKIGSDVLINMPIKYFSMDIKKPIFTIKLAQTVPKNSKGQINLLFEGTMQTINTEALFKTTYNDGSEKLSAISTQLRPTNARRMFPCFDEPGFKTPFTISIKCLKTMTALSNTQVTSVEIIPTDVNYVWVNFNQTPPMSTYTLGLVVGHFVRVKNETVVFKDKMDNSIEISIWGRKDFLGELEGVLEKVIRIFKVITNYWNVPLPLRKLDIVALPNYQGVRPADNWGLIVFKESDLNSRGYLQLTQEIIYQWLGSLVSPKWWSDAHINKALVGYLAAETAIRIDSGSEMDGKWPMTILYSLYYEYSKRYPHSRITGMKQETSSIKIELIFRMLNYTLGEDTLRKGLEMFLQERAFKAFSSDDVWDAINAAATDDDKITKDLSIKTIANSWIDKDRLPYVDITRNYEGKTAMLVQSVYLRERPHDVQDADKMLWWIPIVLVRSDRMDFNNTSPITWMRAFKDANLVNLPDQDNFIIINPEEIGPFPVNYDRRNWALLARFLESNDYTKIPVLTRAKLLHDAWNLAYAGILEFDIALNMTTFMRHERNHLVWDPVFTMIDHLGRHIDSSSVHKKFEAYVRSLLIPLYENYLGPEGNKNEETWRTNLRTLTKTFLCQVGYKPCITEAQAVFKRWMETDNPDEGNPIPNQYICPVFKWGSDEEWEFGLNRVINFPSSRKQSERTYLLKTLAGCPISSEKIFRLLNVTILEGNGNFTDNDLTLIFSMLTGGSRGYKSLYYFVKHNWDVVRQRFENKTSLWNNIISSSTSMFTTNEGLEMVNELYHMHQGQFGSAEHIIEKSLKNIKIEVKWTSDNIPHIDKWLTLYLNTIDQSTDKYIEN